MEKFWESLRQHTITIINFKKKKMIMIPLIKKQQELYEKQKPAKFVRKRKHCVFIILVNIEVQHITYVI